MEDLDLMVKLDVWELLLCALARAELGVVVVAESSSRGKAGEGRGGGVLRLPLGW